MPPTSQLESDGPRRTHGRNWVSVIGTRGSPLALFENRGESVTALTEVLKKAAPDQDKHEVKSIFSYVCNVQMYESWKSAISNLEYISLDTMHLCFMVDAHSKKNGIRPTVVGLVLRSIRGKFSKTTKHTIGGPFTGHGRTKLRASERKAVGQIRHCDMP